MYTLFVDVLLEFTVIFKVSICLNYGKKKKKSFDPGNYFFVCVCVCVCVCVYEAGGSGVRAGGKEN